jgi:dTDP-4-dehydrorhamnose reductase
VLIVGRPGALLRAVARLCELRGLAYHLYTHHGGDDAEASLVAHTLAVAQPWAVIDLTHCAQGTGGECRQAERVALAGACAARGVAFLTLSCACLFDGTVARAYVESDMPSPCGVHARAVYDAEAQVLAALPSALVVRTGPLFDPWDERDPLTTALGALAAGRAVRLKGDGLVSPTYAPDLIHASLDLLVDGESGVWHLANDGAATWPDLVRHAARQAGLDAAPIQGNEARLTYRVLGSERGQMLPSLDDAIVRYLDEGEGHWSVARGQRWA